MLPGGEEGLVGIGLFGSPDGTSRCQNVLDVPVDAIGEIGDRVTQGFKKRDAGIVDVVVGPLRLPICSMKPMPSRRSRRSPAPVPMPGS